MSIRVVYTVGEACFALQILKWKWLYSIHLALKWLGTIKKAQKC